MNKVFHGWLLGLVVLIMTASCQKKVATSLTDGQTYKPWEDALLWEVSKKGMEKPSYVFGTIHLIEKEKYFLPAGFESALNSVEEVVFEIDIEDMMDLSAQMAMMNKAFMKDGLTIKDLLTESEYEELKVFFDDLGIPLFFMERLKPMFISVLASLDGNLEDMQNSGTSYEFEILAMAKDRDLDIGGLETVDFQIGLFDSIPYEEQAQMLMKSIRTKDSNSDEFDLMMEKYTSQNIEEMNDAIAEDEMISKYNALLLHTRNENWIPSIVERIHDHPSLFAVGAGHLAGKKGVLHLLRLQGYNIKPVKP